MVEFASNWVRDPLTRQMEPARLSAVLQALMQLAQQDHDLRQAYSLAAGIHVAASLARIGDDRQVAVIRGRGQTLTGVLAQSTAEGPVAELRRLERAVRGAPSAWLKAWAATRRRTLALVTAYLPHRSQWVLGPGFWCEQFQMVAPAQSMVASAIARAFAEASKARKARETDSDLAAVMKAIDSAVHGLTGRRLGYTVTRDSDGERLSGSDVELVRVVERIYGIALIGRKSAHAIVRVRRSATKNRISQG